jgi:ABC-type multidrug transport system fused ATPase/permease subunit
MVRELIYQSFTLSASTTIHHLMFRTVMRAPMAFFDATPLGRILNRFAVDMDTIDYHFPETSMQALHYTFQVTNSWSGDGGVGSPNYMMYQFILLGSWCYKSHKCFLALHATSPNTNGCNVPPCTTLLPGR